MVAVESIGHSGISAVSLKDLGWVISWEAIDDGSGVPIEGVGLLYSLTMEEVGLWCFLTVWRFR